MKKAILFVLSVVYPCLFLFSQTLGKPKLDAYFQSLSQHDKFMGSVAVSRNGKLIYSHSDGFVDVESKRKANESSKYRIGSISKTFTSVLVFKAIEEKKLNLNQTIAKYFPTIENASKIRIVDLLGHRSGIPNFTETESYTLWNTKPKTEAELVVFIAELGSNFAPDSKFEYSNSNYVLLSYILEKIYGKTYANLLQQQICQPIGLTNTFFGSQINTDNNECNSYLYVGGWQIHPQTDMSIPLGAGGIVSTPSDLIKFAEALFHGKLIKKESLDRMKNVKSNGFGLGLMQVPFGKSIGFGHAGSIDGFNAVFSYFPDKDISFALISNGIDYFLNDISIAVLSAAYSKPYSIPEFNEFEIDIKDLDVYQGVYSSSQLPLKITITLEDGTLTAQATGQSPFPLQATGQHSFAFYAAKIIMEFNPEEKEMTLKQGGGTYLFSKE